MAIVAEDGTCVANANAFVTRAEFITYATDYRPAQLFGADAEVDAAILRASAWLSSYPDWEGKLKCGRGLQGLAWPRTGVTDCNGDAIPDDEVPVEVKQAVSIATLAEISNPGILAPTITTGEQRKRVKVDVIEVEYMTPVDQGITADPAATLRPVLTGVYDLLKCMADFPNGASVPWPWVA